MHPKNPNLSFLKVISITAILLFSAIWPASSQEPDSIINESWDEAGSKWIKDGKSSFTADPDHNLKSSYSYRWDILSSKWIPISKVETSYDGNGNDTLAVVSDWSEITKKWKETFITRYTYDDKGNNTLIFNTYFDDEIREWVVMDKKELSYDENGNDTMDIHYTWDVHTLWTASYKTIYKYDDNGRNNLTYLYSWDQTGTNKWLLFSKNEITFDLKGNAILSMSYSWDSYASQWQHPGSKFESVYDENGNAILDSTCTWNSDSEMWIEMSKNTFTLNVAGEKANIITYIWSGNQWLPVYRGTFYYPGGQVSGVPELEDPDILVYPNPARDFVVINLPPTSGSATIEIWDSRGDKILEQSVPGNQTVNVSTFSAGLYIYKIKYDGTVYCGKILKQ